MFKFQILCVVLAVVAAGPGVAALFDFRAPLTYSTPVFNPAITTYPNHYTGLANPLTYPYVAPLGYSHFIKKRSLQFPLDIAPITYGAPFGNPFAVPITTPVVHSSSVYSGLPISPVTYGTPAHFIKKRSVALALPSTYLAPTTYAASTPYLTPTYSAGPIVHSTPVLSSPFAYSTFIKK